MIRCARGVRLYAERRTGLLLTTVVLLEVAAGLVKSLSKQRIYPFVRERFYARVDSITAPKWFAEQVHTRRRFCNIGLRSSSSNLDNCLGRLPHVDIDAIILLCTVAQLGQLVGIAIFGHNRDLAFAIGAGRALRGRPIETPVAGSFRFW